MNFQFDKAKIAKFLFVNIQTSIRIHSIYKLVNTYGFNTPTIDPNNSSLFELRL